MNPIHHPQAESSLGAATGDPEAHRSLWERYKGYLCSVPELQFTLDPSRMDFPEGFLEAMSPPLERALAAMDALEAGAIANPDEGRRVGHYWLRDPDRAPEPAIAESIRATVARIQHFADRVHLGRLRGQRGSPFRHCLLIGIGGSALGPQLLNDALGSEEDRLTPAFIDNTDPDGIDRTLGRCGARLAETLVLVVSKSGGTQETRNGMLETAAAFARQGLDFPRAAVAVTEAGSALDRQARAEGWLDVFPMWDWVGGRTSVFSAVGLLPAALQGIEIDPFLAGARLMDAATRRHDLRRNPAAWLALMWHHATGGRGQRDMVILPYKDRLLLLSRYLQQLVMESLGKERDREGALVHQGIAVYGNKGSTDQHAFVQQLRDGVDNFFVVFVEVLRDRDGASLEIEPGVTAGDYLHGFLEGTRRALHERGRQSLTITIPEVSSRSLGALIALFERAVGLYASLVNINAYHQPGVEAGKKAAEAVLELQRRLLDAMAAAPENGRSADEWAAAIEAPEAVESVFRILEHLAANPDRRVERVAGPTPWEARFFLRR